MNHLEKQDILSDLQHGYRHGATTETQLLKVIDILTKGIENKHQVDALSLDFSRAFDVVPRERLLLKMRYYGIHHLIPWFRNFLTGRTQTVLVEGITFRFF